MSLCMQCANGPWPCPDHTPNPFASAIEELRMERRKSARLAAGIRDALDNLRRDEPAYRRLELALEERADG